MPFDQLTVSNATGSSLIAVAAACTMDTELLGVAAGAMTIEYWAAMAVWLVCPAEFQP